MKVLISGAGIAGPTLAYWLHHYGHSVTLVEKSPSLRTNGYVIDFWGLGFDVVEKMGISGIGTNFFSIVGIRTNNCSSVAKRTNF